MEVTSVVVAHTVADFDALASACGLAVLWGPGAVAVLPGGETPYVKRYLDLHKQQLPLRPLATLLHLQPPQVGVVDTHKLARIGAARQLVHTCQTLTVIDHHTVNPADCDLVHAARTLQLERVGACSTLVAERLRQSGTPLSPALVTLLALGIHLDTGSLTYEATTPRDAEALAWLMQQGASVADIALHRQAVFTAQQQAMLARALAELQKTTLQGVVIGHVLLVTDGGDGFNIDFATIADYGRLAFFLFLSLWRLDSKLFF
jgi:tRNA nucleotidyltransferase (CCA-adding enzyme)